MSSASPNSTPASVKEGQTVKFIPRDASAEARPVPYYDYYNGLYGKITKIYDDETAAVIVDRVSLPEDARERHEKSERDMRDKWLRSLSEDDRSKLTEVQKQFSLRYTILAAIADLAVISSDGASVVSPASRPTDDSIQAAEAAHLEEIKRRALEG